MRVVVDTNVFVSAVLKDRSLPALAVQFVERHATLLKSTATEQQLVQVIARPHLAALIAPAALQWIHAALAGAVLVAINERVVACRDPTDDKFLELAVNGQADFILSGDNDLLVLHPFRGTPILAPATFLQTAPPSRQ